MDPGKPDTQGKQKAHESADWVLALSLQSHEGQRLNQTSPRRTRALAEGPKRRLGLEFQSGRRGSSFVSMQPVQMHGAFCSEGPCASSLTLCGRHLELFNNLIFEFVL